MSNACNASNTFIDLATFSEIEGFLYGGVEAITHFVASVLKSNWFSFIPIILRPVGTLDFGQRNSSVCVNRSGDYVMQIWFRAQIPQIQLVQAQQGQQQIFGDAKLRWTRNLMHNLFDQVTITFNELVVQEFGSFWMDNSFQLSTPGGKRVGYRNMIGDVASMTTPVPIGVPLGDGSYRSVPLPFWFTLESGLALPVAALPFNDIKVNYSFRRWEELVIVYPGTAGFGPIGGRIATVNDVSIVGQSTQKPALIDPQTVAHYVVVHNDERVKMGDAPRDMLIHQVQATQHTSFKDVSSRSTFDLRLSHSIVYFNFSARNNTVQKWNGGTGGAEWSNYTTQAEIFGPGADPIAYSTLVYENTVRLAAGSDYYSLTVPYFFFDAIPDESGYHAATYALHPLATTGASGSTNYSKLANVSIAHDMSPAAQAAAGINVPAPIALDGSLLTYPNQGGVEEPMPQQWEHWFVARNWNIARAANGSLGQPTL